MAHKQCGLWREKEKANPKPKVCPKCGSKKLSPIVQSAEDSDDFDNECAEAWALEQDAPINRLHEDARFAYYEDLYECHRCGHWGTYGARHYFNPETLDYDCDRPLMPDAARRVELEHERQSQIDAGQLSLL